jgi:hypothetical protein
MLIRSALVLLIALALAPMIRGITADMTESVGSLWPFAMEHCRSQQTPGCTFAGRGRTLIRFRAAG